MGTILQAALAALRTTPPVRAAAHDAHTVAASCGFEPGNWHLVQITIEGATANGQTTALARFGDEFERDGVWAVLFGGVWVYVDGFRRSQVEVWHHEAIRQCQGQALCDSVHGGLS